MPPSACDGNAKVVLHAATEIEDPFGDDQNDLPFPIYAEKLGKQVDWVYERRKLERILMDQNNMVIVASIDQSRWKYVMVGTS